MALTREFLEQQGLEADVISQIMKEHGKTVQPLNEQVEQLTTANTQLTSQVTERDNQLAELKNGGDDALKEQITQLQADNEALKETYANELNATIKTHKIEMLANEIGASDVDWAKDKLAKLELKDGELDGADDLVNELKEKHPVLFATQEQAEPEGIRKWSQGGLSTINSVSYGSREEVMAIEDNAKRQKAIEDNIHLFR